MPAPSDPPPADHSPDKWAERHGAAVRGYIFGLVRRDDLADDLAQEVFRRAWEARHRYREQGHARAYLLRIADRLVCDHARRMSREVTIDDAMWSLHEPAAHDSAPEADAMAGEARRRLLTALDTLSEAQRRVLLLRYYGELDFRQIAEALECPLNTALSHCRRGLEALRKQLVEQP